MLVDTHLFDLYGVAYVFSLRQDTFLYDSSAIVICTRDHIVSSFRDLYMAS